MTGRVKMYNEDKGYGFIAGEDGSDYFVHISAVSGAAPLYHNASVTFEPSENERGKIAKKVSVIEGPMRPTFIQFGNIRVKLSNIKNYGIDTCNSYYCKVYEYSPELAQKIENDNRKQRGLFKVLSTIFSEEPYEWKGEKIYIASFLKEFALKAVGINPDDPDDHRQGYAYIRKPDGTLELDKEDDFLEIKENFLYVKTYQNDSFEFPEGEVDFNIFEKCKEIDSYML